MVWSCLLLSFSKLKIADLPSTLHLLSRNVCNRIFLIFDLLAAAKLAKPGAYSIPLPNDNVQHNLNNTLQILYLSLGQMS